MAYLATPTHILCALLVLSVLGCNAQEHTTSKNKPQHKSTTMKEDFTSHLSEQEYYVLAEKGTDRPGDYGYTNTFEEGTYHCRACGAALYTSESKFHSGCGWPAFDSEISGAVNRHVDNSLGMKRTEITCSNCGGHLGHVFEGEHFTATNTRHCVNTSSLVFHPKNVQTVYLSTANAQELQFALYKNKGVLFTEIGTVQESPTQSTKVVKVTFNPSEISVADVAKRSALQTTNTTQQTTVQQKIYTTASIATSESTQPFTLQTIAENQYTKAAPQEQHTLLKQQRATK